MKKALVLSIMALFAINAAIAQPAGSRSQINTKNKTHNQSTIIVPTKDDADNASKEQNTNVTTNQPSTSKPGLQKFNDRQARLQEQAAQAQTTQQNSNGVITTPKTQAGGSISIITPEEGAKKIQSYVDGRYPGVKVTSISTEKDGKHEATLSNGIKLLFNKNYEFVKVVNNKPNSTKPKGKGTGK